VTNRVLRGVDGIRIGMHLCRGNRGGHWHAEGSYDTVAEKLFNALDIAFFFLEYDSARAGDFSPLRHVPKHKSIVLGLISTKTPALEDKAALQREVDV
ncbi:MAG: 5-methyltetrahydropteroyltriglutamate--homocysteine S-methyltransferase, partial [Burkholderiales bacterium]